LAYWTSQKDAGPSDAIRKGFEKATGSILAYLNSDDLYLPGTLHHLVNRLRTTGADVAYGNMYWIDEQSRIVAERRQTPFSRLAYMYGGADLQQPAMIWTNEIYHLAGGMDPRSMLRLIRIYLRVLLPRVQSSLTSAGLSHVRVSIVLKKPRFCSKPERKKRKTSGRDTPRCPCDRFWEPRCGMPPECGASSGISFKVTPCGFWVEYRIA